MSNSADYPPPAFAFSVAIASGSPLSPDTTVDAAFQEISGIDPTNKIQAVQEGGTASYVHQLPGATKHPNIVLKRGYVTAGSALAQWAFETIGSTAGQPITAQVLNVCLLGSDEQALVTWTFNNAWPVKCEVGTPDANQPSTVVIQMLEFAYGTVSARNGSPAGQT
jgi:phage tail-like protein